MGFLWDTGVLGPAITSSIPPAIVVSCGLSFRENMPNSRWAAIFDVSPFWDLFPTPLTNECIGISYGVMGWITRDANGKANWVSSSTILSSSEVIVSADLNSISGRFVVLLLVVYAREPDDFLDFGTTVISLWDIVINHPLHLPRASLRTCLVKGADCRPLAK